MSRSSKDEDGSPSPGLDFVRTRVAEDVARGASGEFVHTRFPPEPNGYLHIGHAKAICLNFGIAGEYTGAHCNLRFDDTNPSKEEVEYVDSIIEDIRWLGFDWGDRLFFTSDYFERLAELAVQLIRSECAYVDDLGGDEMREYRGTLTTPGRDSPFRDRSVEENLQLFERMRGGEFEDGSRTLRARIDMTSPNMNLRDPVMYRILRSTHHRTGDRWCIYPTYDWAHGQSDAIEGITHSLCTLEFENHRPLYDWFLDHLDLPARPQQIEFARLNLTHTVLSKRKLLRLVQEDRVTGWDDPRMPTIRGLRRKGYTPEAIRNFCAEIGIAKFNSTVDLVKLENSLREDLNARAPRRLGVLHPLKLVITNYPEDHEEEVDAIENPQDLESGTRKVPFSRELYIEHDDFREEAPGKFRRLTPGREVRLRYAYYVTCTGCEKDPTTGEVTAVHATYDPETRGGNSADGRKVKGTIHWVSARHAVRGEVRVYDHLFREPHPENVEEGQDFTAHLNPDSLEVLADCPLEPSLASLRPGQPFQLERLGYFCLDPEDSEPGALVLNRTVGLRDTWAKIEKKLASGSR